MNKIETIALMKKIKGYYPAYYKDSDLNEAVALWYDVLTDESADLIQKSLVRYVKTDTKGYPPVLGQLIALAKEIRHQENLRLNQERFDKAYALSHEGQATEETPSLVEAYRSRMAELEPAKEQGAEPQEPLEGDQG